MKPTLQVDVSTDDISTDSSSHDTQALLDLCLALQQRVKSLETLVKTQNVRISDLETTLTNNLIQKIQNEQDNEDTAAVKSNNKSSVNSQINMKETPGETKVDSASDEQKSPSTSDSKASSTEAANVLKRLLGSVLPHRITLLYRNIQRLLVEEISYRSTLENLPLTRQKNILKII